MKSSIHPLRQLVLGAAPRDEEMRTFLERGLGIGLDGPEYDAVAAAHRALRYALPHLDQATYMRTVSLVADAIMRKTDDDVTRDGDVQLGSPRWPGFVRPWRLAK